MDLSTVNINSIDLHSVDLSYLNQTDVDALILAYFSYEAAHSEDTNLAPPVLRTVWILLAISTIVVTTRLAVKLRTTRRLYTDDGLMGTALVSPRRIRHAVDLITKRPPRYLLGSTPPSSQSLSKMVSAVTYSI